MELLDRNAAVKPLMGRWGLWIAYEGSEIDGKTINLGNSEKDFLIWQNLQTPVAEFFDDET
ncbi:hypothetical protein, partial [Pseudomonas lactucae]|uniref:hypothetical protein n=1 Tax=Pseudomonas lactucae TaxID=2813360 RepID=UPI002FCD5232